jgi:hypothetical protein
MNRNRLFIKEIACIPKIYNLYIELGIQQNVLRFDITMGYAMTVYVSKSRNELAEDVSSTLLTKLLSLIY